VCILTMDAVGKRPGFVHHRMVNLSAHRRECKDGVVCSDIMLEMGGAE